MHNYFQGPPQSGLTLSELREYIRTPKKLKDRLTVIPQTVTQQPTFQQRFGIDPRNFVRQTIDDPKWTDEGKETLEEVWKGNVSDTDAQVLGEAFYNTPDPKYVQTSVKGKQIVHSQQKEMPTSTKWWRDLKLPKATSAGTVPKE